MTNKHLTFAIFGNSFQPRKSHSLLRVLAFLREHGAKAIFDRPFYDFLTEEQSVDLGEVGTFEGDDFDADYVVSMGGDGTFLKSAVRVGCKQIPLIGVNMGRLGFLADVLPGEVETALQANVQTVRSHRRKAERARLNGRRYFSSLREKMMWGADKR